MSWVALLKAVAPWLVKKLGPRVIDWIGDRVSTGERDPSRTGTQKRNAILAEILAEEGDLSLEPDIRTTIEIALVHLRAEGGLGGAEDGLRAHMSTAADLCIHHGAGSAGRALRAWMREEDS